MAPRSRVPERPAISATGPTARKAPAMSVFRLVRLWLQIKTETRPSQMVRRGG